MPKLHVFRLFLREEAVRECFSDRINSAPYAYRMSRESEVNVQPGIIAPHFYVREEDVLAY